MKGAMIPPTRENMEQAPIPTFLKKQKSLISDICTGEIVIRKMSLSKEKKKNLSHDPDHINRQSQM